MKRTLFSWAIALTLCLGFSAVTMAAESSQSVMNQPQKGSTNIQEQTAEQLAKVAPITATEIIGSAVLDDNGKMLGSISNLVISRDGSFIFPILSLSRFSGMGEKVLPIPWWALHHGKDKGVFIISMTEEQIQKAPNLEEGDLANLKLADMRANINRYYAKAMSAPTSQDVSTKLSEGTGQWKTEAGYGRPEKASQTQKRRAKRGSVVSWCVPATSGAATCVQYRTARGEVQTICPVDTPAYALGDVIGSIVALPFEVVQCALGHCP